MKKTVALLLSILLAFSFCGCAETTKKENKNEKLKVVTSIFPAYDFAREIVGDKADIEVLLKPGIESHGYEPTLKDIAAMNKCDVMIYVGGITDSWVEDVIEDSDMNNKKIFRFLDIIEPLPLYDEEEISEHSHETEIDDHVWTSPKNAKKLVEEISKVVISADKENAEYYKKRTETYLEKLDSLDKDLERISKNSNGKPLIFADRFPFRYMAKDYGFEALSALDGCTSDTEPTISAINKIVGVVNENDIKVIFYVDSSDGKIADKVSSITGAEKELLHSCHNVASDEKNENYISLMKRNIKVLREALG